jgi:hypothetical protein
MCLPQVIKSFQNYREVATTFYPILVFIFLIRLNRACPRAPQDGRQVNDARWGWTFLEGCGGGVVAYRDHRGGYY